MRLVLVVDDSRIQRARVRNALMPLGLQVDEAASGMQALDRLREIDPDLVVLDTHLPDLDGLDVLRALRSYQVCCPVVMVTADQQELTTHLLRAHGAADVLHKPFEATRLIEAVEEVLSVA